MSSIIQTKAYAKINLCLDITGRREDGYHLLRTVMQNVSLWDELTVTRLPEQSGIRLTCSDPQLTCGPSNTAYRAAEVFLEAVGSTDGVEIVLKKGIPMQAGMGGGSADAAAVLRALNELYGRPLTRSELLKLGVRVGADVPFCLVGGTALCEGIGEIITPLSPLPHCFFVLCKPQEDVSTAQAFAAVDRADFRSAQSAQRMCDAIGQGDISVVGSAVSNDFLIALEPQQSLRVIQQMKPFAPLGACMTGSGPTVFAMFERWEDAGACASALRCEYDQVWVTEPVVH